MRLAHKVMAIALLVSIAGCGGGEPPKRFYPPKASVQELAVQPNGQWKLTLRLQNFSSGPMTYSALNAKLTVNDRDASQIELKPELKVGPETADIVTATITPGTEAKIAVASALAGRREVHYRLKGKITSREPDRDDEFDTDSILNPAPGLNGVLR